MSWLPARSLAIVASTLVLAGCGSESQGPAVARVASGAATPIQIGSATSCGAVVSATFAAIGRRIYGQAAHGRNVVAAVRRLRRSAALATAVADDDPRATSTALTPLLKHQIRSIEITRGTHVLADVHGSATLAPVRGVIRDRAGNPLGRYVLSVSDLVAVAQITSSLTGAGVTVRSGSRTLERVGVGTTSAAGAAGATKTVSYGATAYPHGALRVVLALPAAAPSWCGTTPRATVAQTIGAVGERLFRTEESGAAVARVLRHVAGDAQLRHAVATDDPVLLRTAIIRFFRTRSLHVVRVRATMADGRLVGDVGGPYVLAPASIAVRDARGRRLGTVTLAIQDDTGYIKLMQRFTGAAVLLRTAAGPVPGSTLSPGPPTIPPRGTVAYRGRQFDTYTFTARAFPAGPLSIALLLPRATT